MDADLAHQPIYHVYPKRAYSIDILINDSTRLLSEKARLALRDDEKFNLEEAGKCLAFEVPTAAAFHLVRAVESVIRRYYHEVVGVLPKPKMRNWGAYLKRLRDCNADPKITSALEQIKDLHRNPVIHPETQLSNEEALSLVGVLSSAMEAMIADIDARQRAKTLPDTSQSSSGADRATS